MKATTVFATFLLFALPPMLPIADYNAAEAKTQFPKAQAFLSPGMTPIADGLNTIRYQVAIVNADGTPMTRFRGSANFSTGDKGKIKDLKNGQYAIDVTPQSISSIQEVTLTLNGKGRGQKVNQSWKLRWHPAQAGENEISVNPPTLILTRDESATITIILDVPDANNAELLMRTSVGSLDNITNLGDGQYSARFVPPKKIQYPHNALLTYVDARAPNSTYGTLTIPQHGKTKFPVNTMPNSSVILEIGGKSFGPVKANSNGKTKIPIVVPPGVPQARLISAIGKSKNESMVDLKIPTAKRILFFPTLETVPADDGIQIPIQFFVAKADGTPDTAAKYRLKASTGEIGNAKHIGNGVYQADYTPPTGESAQEVTLSANLLNESPKRQTDTIAIKVIPSRAQKVHLNPDANILPKNAKSINVFAKVRGPNNRTLSKRDLHFSAINVKPGNSKSLGNGDYSAKFAITGDGPIQIVGSVRGEPSENPLAGFVMDAAQTRFENDGLSSNQLTIVALDAYGTPIPNVSFQIDQIKGDATVPSSAKTNEYGFSHLQLTAGKKMGPIHLRIYNEKVSSEYVLLQIPSGLASHLNELPASGSNQARQNIETWKSAIASVVIGREGRLAEKVTSTSVSSGDIKAIEISVQPAKIAPGGKVTLEIRATDNKGVAVPNARLKGKVVPGKSFRIQDLGGGTYRATITAPKNLKAKSLKVSVSSSNEKISSFKNLPVINSASSSTNEKTSPKPNVSSVGSGDAKKSFKLSSGTVKDPSLRIAGGMSFGTYAYQQMPTDTGGIYQKSITFNGDAGSESASTVGLFIRAKGQLSSIHPMLGFVGAEAQFSSDRYSVILEEFNDPIVDWVSALNVALIPRYPFTLNNNQIHLGARIGFSNDDFMIFQQKETDNPEEVELIIGTQQISGLFVGGELGFELDMGIYGDITFDTAIGEGIYQKLQLNVGYPIYQKASLTAGFRSTIRELGLAGQNGPVGDVRDGNTAIFIGAAYPLD